VGKSPTFVVCSFVAFTAAAWRPCAEVLAIDEPVPSSLKEVKEVHTQGSSTMEKYGVVVVTGALVAFGVLSSTGAASAMPSDHGSAADTVANLQADGHHVQLNGHANVPLTLCKVTGVHGLHNSNIDASGSRIDDDLFSTVYVDVKCQDG
jgi:hypothetical protein